MKSLLSFLLGIVLTVLGAGIFLSKVRVSNYTFFYRFHGTNITALLLLVFCIVLVVYIVYPGFVTAFLLGLTFLGFLVSIILSMNFYIVHVTALEVLIMLAMFFGGIGLTLRAIVDARRYEDQVLLRGRKKKDKE